MLRASSSHSSVWIQGPPLNYTYVAACTEELALSLSLGNHTPHAPISIEFFANNTTVTTLTYLTLFFFFQFGRDHQLCTRCISFLICNY